MEVVELCSRLVAITGCLLFFCCSTFLAVAQQNNGRAVVEGSNSQWYVDDQPDRIKDAQMAEFLGRESLG